MIDIEKTASDAMIGLSEDEKRECERYLISEAAFLGEMTEYEPHSSKNTFDLRDGGELRSDVVVEDSGYFKKGGEYVLRFSINE